MKKYLLLVIGVFAMVTMGNAVAITLNASNLAIKTITPTIQPLDGGCGGGCGGGCHNNSTMTEITGTLVLFNNTKFKIDSTILNFGCYSFINSTTSSYDFDGDGTLEIIFNELLGLVGTSITVEGYPYCHNSRLIVYYINGILYRDWGCPNPTN